MKTSFENYNLAMLLLVQVTDALARAGLESSNLIVGIDFTKSNEWTGLVSSELVVILVCCTDMYSTCVDTGNRYQVISPEKLASHWG